MTPLSPGRYAAAAREIVTLTERLQAVAIADTPRQRQARTRAINRLAQAVKRLQLRNAGLPPLGVLVANCPCSTSSGSTPDGRRVRAGHAPTP